MNRLIGAAIVVGAALAFATLGLAESFSRIDIHQPSSALARSMQASADAQPLQPAAPPKRRAAPYPSGSAM